MRMKQLATVLMIAAAGIAVIQWCQIAYRLYLFLGEFRSERGVNHIGSDTFILIYIINAMLLVGTVVALWVFWRSSCRWRTASGVIGIVNMLGWLAFFTMHRLGVLVTYEEFIRHWKGI
jgi:hypothetical protein